MNAPRYQGHLELHLTTDCTDPAAFYRTLQGTGLKPVMVRLHGVTDPAARTLQLMTAEHHWGTLSGALRKAKLQEKKLKGLGLNVVRTKIETALTARGLPRKNEDLAPDCYFELHARYGFHGDDEKRRLVDAARRGQLALSDALLPDGGTGNTLFVSARFAMGLPNMQRSTRDLLGQMALWGWHAQKTHSEFVIHDTNPGLDQGWAVTR